MPKKLEFTDSETLGMIDEWHGQLGLQRHNFYLANQRAAKRGELRKMLDPFAAGFLAGWVKAAERYAER